MSKPKMTVLHKSGLRTRHEPSEDMTWGLSTDRTIKEISLPVPHHLGEEYVRDYNRGWRARPGHKDWDDGTGTVGFDDGYMDKAADREKWHLAWCDMHDNTGSGCGRA